MNAEGFLLDTNICIFLFRGKFDIQSRLDKIEHKLLYLRSNCGRAKIWGRVLK